MHQIPKVSICIPVYEMHGKGIPFLKVLLTSIVKQTYKNIEIVISDHSITDEIEKFIGLIKSDIIERNIEIIYLKFTEMRGNSSANLNNAIKHANGNIIKPIFQDDFFCNDECIAQIVEYSITYPKYLWGMTGFIHTDEDITNYYGDQTPVYNTEILIGKNTMGCPSGLFFRNSQEPILFDEKLVWLMDCEFYYKLFKLYGKPIVISKTCVAIRIWNQSFTKEVDDYVKNYEEIYVLEKYKETKESLNAVRIDV